MVGALGSTSAGCSPAFALGSALAALGGALQLPREPANLGLDLTAIGDASCRGGGRHGRIPGAYLAALIIGVIKALCYGIETSRSPGVAVLFQAHAGRGVSW